MEAEARREAKARDRPPPPPVETTEPPKPSKSEAPPPPKRERRKAKGKAEIESRRRAECEVRPPSGPHLRAMPANYTSDVPSSYFHQVCGVYARELRGALSKRKGELQLSHEAAARKQARRHARSTFLLQEVATRADLHRRTSTGFRRLRPSAGSSASTAPSWPPRSRTVTTACVRTRSCAMPHVRRRRGRAAMMARAPSCMRRCWASRKRPRRARVRRSIDVRDCSSARASRRASHTRFAMRMKDWPCFACPAEPLAHVSFCP